MSLLWRRYGCGRSFIVHRAAAVFVGLSIICTGDLSFALPRTDGESPKVQSCTPGLSSAFAPVQSKLMKPTETEVNLALSKFRERNVSIENQSRRLRRRLVENSHIDLNTPMGQKLVSEYDQLKKMEMEFSLDFRSFMERILTRFGFQIAVHENPQLDPGSIPGIVAEILQKKIKIKKLAAANSIMFSGSSDEKNRAMIQERDEQLRELNFQLEKLYEKYKGSKNFQVAVEMIQESVRRFGNDGEIELLESLLIFQMPQIEIISFPMDFAGPNSRGSRLAQSIKKKYQTKIVVPISLGQVPNSFNKFYHFKDTSMITLDPYLVLNYDKNKVMIRKAIVHESIHANYGRSHTRGQETDLDIVLKRVNGANLVGKYTPSYHDVLPLEELHAFTKHTLMESGKFIKSRLNSHEYYRDLGLDLVTTIEMIQTALKSLEAAQTRLKQPYTPTFQISKSLSYSVDLPVAVNDGQRVLTFHFSGERPDDSQDLVQKMREKIERAAQRIQLLSNELDKIVSPELTRRCTEAIRMEKQSCWIQGL